MNITTNLRQIYHPVQPTIKQSGEHVTYAEYLPDPLLQNVIYCYWELQTTAILTNPFVYRVVADGCIDIFFEIGQPQDNFVMGFCKKFTEFPLENSFRYIGIRFLPTMFPQIFRINAAELSNRFEALYKFAPSTASFVSNNFGSNQTAHDIVATLDDHFISLLQNTSFDNDHRLYNAIEIVCKNFGVVDVEQELNTGISQRQLRRLFEFYIGDSAKTFAKVVRFQNILRARPSIQSLRQNKLFFDAGYYDQAHFIKEFKNFYGVTPGKALGR